jgi:NAD-dependent DNA ligase
MFTREIQALQGIATAIIYDGRVDDAEIDLLAEWVTKNLEFSDVWPISEVYEVLRAVLEDGKVTSEERSLLLATLDKVANPLEEDGRSHPSLCDQDPDVCFEGKSFLITGRLQMGSRRVAQEKIKALGGAVKKAPLKDLDYLVVGELGTDQWTYSRYGRKIEAVMQNRNRGCGTRIVTERDFLSAMISAETCSREYT